MAVSPKAEAMPGRRPAKLLVLGLAFVAAAAGFGLSFFLAPSVLHGPEPGSETVPPRDAGSFAVKLPGKRMQLVEATATVRPDVGAPESPAALHDAILVLLADATALPLVQDGHGSLEELAAVVLSMAKASAPWLVGIELRIADENAGSTAKAEEAGPTED